MISLAHITQGDAVRNTTLSRTLPGALTKAFISEWIQPQLPGTAESQRLGRPRALPLYPIASTFSSAWSVTTVPTWSREQVERFASSSAIRMYTSYSGTRSGCGGGGASSGSVFRRCVLAGTPSLDALMDVPVGVVVGVPARRAVAREPGVEARCEQAVRALLALRRTGCEVVGVFVLRMPRVALDPVPGHLVRRRRLHQLLPQLQVLERAALALPATRLPSLHPLRHSLDHVGRVGHVQHPGTPPLPADPFEHCDGACERHPVVGRVGRALVEVPPGDAVAGRRLDQGAVAARVGRLHPVPEAALVGDRKSTRLNSSHLVISYAVFCLKKKKN